jgi:hypothetical protein
MSEELGFPTEVIDLPSKGKFYPEGSPLREGKLELKYMTAKEEDILTSTNLISKGIVLDKLCDSLIVTKNVTSKDLLLGDLNAVVVASRILGYGKEYPITVSCPLCGKENNIKVNLVELKDKVPTLEPGADGLFELKLATGTMIKFKLLTRRDELSINQEIEKMNKALKDDVSRQLSTRLRHIVVEVNGSKDKNEIYRFTENMLVKDTKALREAYQQAQPDLDFEISYDCSCDEGTDQKVRLPLGPDFFWPDLRV